MVAKYKYYCYLQPTDEIRSLLLAIGVTYLARLETKTRQRYAGYLQSYINNLMGETGHGSHALMEQVDL